MNLITLVIDDDPMMCFIHKRLLNQNLIAHDPLIFNNGQLALDYLLKNYKTENEYLILLDIHMPVMNGWAFLQEIDREFGAGNLNVFIVSSSIQVAEHQSAAGYMQVVEFMEKPLKAENLEKIKSLVNSLKII